MKRLVYLAALVLFLSSPVFARQKLQGWCEDGGKTVTVPGGTGPTTTKWQQSFASCTVTVYDVGTTNLSTIYGDNSGTAKANPFTSASSGQWFFYADNSRYDVKFSGGGISTPFTLGDFNLNDQAEQTWTYKSVVFSATPAFDASQNSLFAMTLTANVTSSTVSNAKTGRVIGFNLCQDTTGGRTLVWPASFLRPPTIASGASQCTNAAFFYDGTNWRELAVPGDTVRHDFQTHNNVRYTDQFFGTTAGAKIINCIADLPSTGGTCDARGLEGAQTISADPFVGVTKTVRLILGASTYTVSANMTIPSNVTVEFVDGSSLSINTAVTVTWSGDLVAGLQKIFTLSGTGLVSISAGSPLASRDILPQWWGASPSAAAATNTTAIQAALDTGLKVYLPAGSYTTNAALQFGDFYRLAGAGVENTTIVNTTTDVITKKTASAKVTRVSLSNFAVHAGTASVRGSKAFNLSNFYTGYFSHLKVRFASAGLYLKKDVGGEVVLNTFDKINILNSNVGLELDSTGQSINENRFTDVHIEDSQGLMTTGLKVFGYNNLFTGLTIETVTTDAVVIGATSGNNIFIGPTLLVSSVNAFNLSGATGGGPNYVIGLSVDGISGAINDPLNKLFFVGSEGSDASGAQIRGGLKGKLDIHMKRFYADAGTALVAGDFALSGWGTGATVTAVTGTDQAWQVTVTAGTTPAASPTITLTFKDGTWTNAPICVTKQVGGTGVLTNAVTEAPTATTNVITWNGTPVNTSTYIFASVVVGR